jgi:hypothetical protein
LRLRPARTEELVGNLRAANRRLVALDGKALRLALAAQLGREEFLSLWDGGEDAVERVLKAAARCAASRPPACPRCGAGWTSCAATSPSWRATPACRRRSCAASTPRSAAASARCAAPRRR